ncbi:hypothetical protein PSHT_07843 [Puccinia striiformis]|uniref:Large ribosomal subunit protein mL49 n=2 Tax=Puccinia striiformis TaxID=27350 RepID=A0A2S4VUF7_9BASI|nr:hypothetical protein PSTT_10752 [Puccinia striiformis]POW13143.1 hypothetical protein PSHT_07843 [Puccinia striiformis]
MASAGPRRLYRLVSKSSSLRPLLSGHQGLPVTNVNRRWSMSAAPEKSSSRNESSKSWTQPERGSTRYHTSGEPTAKKAYEFNIPDRVWRAPTHTPENPLKYSIRRTMPYNTLPVYSIMKPRLGQVLTCIRKIDGDLYKLKEDLILDFPGSQPVLKLNIGQVICRGQIVKEVKLWLQDRGF